MPPITDVEAHEYLQCDACKRHVPPEELVRVDCGDGKSLQLCPVCVEGWDSLCESG